MSDAHRRYRAIRTSLLHLFPTAPTGHQARHFQTLVAFICGIVGSESTQLPKIAAAAPSGGVDRESFIKRMKRWSKNNNVDVRASYLPFARHIMRKCASSGVTIAFDGSAVARNCVALVASIIYQNRALPIAWVVVSGKKGHFPESMHCELLEHIHTLIPAQTPVTIVGDGEFDGTTFLSKIDAYKWSYVCRTACSILITADNITFRIGDVPAEVDTIIVIPNACMTAERYGPINALVLWNEKDHEAMYLVTTMDDADAAVATYRRRCVIETFFSDQKSRGFRLESSHMRDPARVSRLLLAACLAYVWIVYLGLHAGTALWGKRIHRHDRCDLSLFQLGLRLLAYCLTEVLPIPPTFETSAHAG